MLRDTHAGNVRGSSSGTASAGTRKKTARPKVTKPPVKERLHQLGPVGEMKTHASRAAYRLRKKIAKAKGYMFPADLHIVEYLEQAAAALESTALRLDQVPKTWRPAHGSIGGVPIEQGARVHLKTAYHKAHIELTDTSVTMVVTRVVGAKIVCRVEHGLEKGMTIPMPRAHVERIPEAEG